jgi:hypothetical protein
MTIKGELLGKKDQLRQGRLRESSGLLEHI